MELNDFQGHGRQLLVEFTCTRCKKTVTRPLKECLPNEHNCRGLYDLSPPKEWYNGGFYYNMLCPKCKKAYDDFMRSDNNAE